MLPHVNALPDATLVARVWRPGIGPALARLDGDALIDITSRDLPTMQALLEAGDPAATARAAKGTGFATLAELVAGSTEDAGPDALRFLSPADLQAIKASGVTFAESMVERVIEEQAAGDADRAEAIRGKVKDVIGDSLSGIGPDAEVFTKAQPMSSVGWGAAVGLHPISKWNNPEPEIVLAVNARGEIVGATLGNDVNLRDIEGRSALLLGKAKDNNASCAIGPFLRLFDARFSLDDVRGAELSMRVEGEDGFTLEGHSSMNKISRDPADLVRQTIGRHHQYPDGIFLFLGTMFAPIKDRDAAGQGFTHHTGDVVTISEPGLGALRNTVRLSTDCPQWSFGTAALMRNLAGRGLL